MLGFITKLIVPPYQKAPPLKRVAILVPLSKRNELTPDEKISMRHLLHYLGSYDKYLIAPRGMKLHLEGFTVKSFSRKYFGSMWAHSRLLYLPMFWETFQDYRYVLMYHLDALVFRDELQEWCDMDLDYIGAPFIPCADTPWVKEPWVGNGGFALMKVESVLKILTQRYRMQPARFWEDRFAGLLSIIRTLLRYPRKIAPTWMRTPLTRRLSERLRMDGVEVLTTNNDALWSYQATQYLPEFKRADWKTGIRFAFEAAPSHCFELNGHKLPFGCHAWQKFDRKFWEPFLLKDPQSNRDEPLPARSF
jgi:hypothetical protein